MLQSLKTKCRLNFSIISLISIFYVSINAYALGSETQFLIDGKTPQYWTASVGNALAYEVKIDNQKAKAKRKSVVVTPGKKEEKGDALKIKWKGRVIKNQWGSGNILHDSIFKIGGPKVDLSSYVDSHAIVLDLKVDKAPGKLTQYSLECNWSGDCRNSIPINLALKKLPRKKWVKLPIPLSCFNHNNFDFSQLTSIGTISTQGILDIELANVYLAEIPEGQRGCK